MRAYVLAAACASIGACSAAATTSGTAGSGDAASATASGSSGAGGGSLFDGGTGGGAGGDGCSEAAKLVYVLSEESALYSFTPPTLALSKVGDLACPAAPGATPYSMAVDRAGVAWVLYGDGSLYHVSTKDASCTATAFAAGNPSFAQFGMGFVADAPGSSSETLYVASVSGSALGKIDTTTLALSVVGSYDAIFQSAELTGTASAELYGFFTSSPPVVARIDPATAKILSQAPQPSVQIGTAWAFAFWGGDFWLFSAPGVASRIDRYRPADGTTVTLKSNVGFYIVGAGVSTCAPLTTPT